MMATVCSLSTGIRAWGGWSRQNFAYTNAAATPPININLSADHEINLIAIGQNANWGRCAHEFGHNVVSAPTFAGDGTATLGEDVYASDLVDGSAATARQFDMMGSHDTHPLFSGYHLEKLGYYTAANIQQLTWDRNPFSQEFDVVAHGLAEDATGRVHLIKIKVADGLSDYVQVRQRPGATAQIFDDSIPLGGAPNQGGVIVTRVIADTLNINQQTRFITLMHDEEVLQQGEFADDPARGLRITVINGSVQARPLVCRVRVEWAQSIVDDPSGSFDLRVEPWDGNYQTPDIWVDRAPFGAFDQPLDGDGRPTGNGDKPRPGELNRLKGRIHVSGAMGASDVKATFYAVFPPGVGDNGNWAPLGMHTIAHDPAERLLRRAAELGPRRRRAHVPQALRQRPTGRDFRRQQLRARERVRFRGAGWLAGDSSDRSGLRSGTRWTSDASSESASKGCRAAGACISRTRGSGWTRRVKNSSI